MPQLFKTHFLVTLNFLLVSPVIAQITSDNTLTVPTVVNTTDPLNIQITDGTRVGNNLYHSFHLFSVPTGSTATFLNPSDIVNIFSRITGSQVSYIDGLIKNQGTANLFLLNPNGIIFGANAALDIGGSFVATTAESIVFPNKIIFSSNLEQSSPLLSINLPIGLQFGQQAQPIQVRILADQFVVKPQKTLALLGGDINIVGSPLPSLSSSHLTALGGRIELGSVAPESLVDLTSITKGWRLDYGRVSHFQDITLAEGVVVDVSVLDSLPEEITGGNIQVFGRNITLTGGSGLASTTENNQDSGNIMVNASDTLRLTGFRPNSSFSSGIVTITFGSGNAGNIIVNAKQLIIQEGAGISSQAFEDFDNNFNLQGKGGNLQINATELVEITGSNPEIGNSKLTVQTRTAGNAGNINITTKQLIIRDGAEITASTIPFQDFINTGNGGEINITATDLIDVEGTGLSRSFDPTTGTNVIIPVPSRIIAGTESYGDGSNINLITNRLIVDQQGQITSSATRSGNAGEINIQGNLISISRQGAITTNATGTGDAGNIRVQAQTLSIFNQGRIGAESDSGNEGNIILNASESIVLRNWIGGTPPENPYISTRSGTQAGGGNGGNITITTPFLITVANENTDIVANAFTGKGGSINVEALGIFGIDERPTFTDLSDFNVSSQFGASGTVNITRLGIDPQEGFAKLPTDVVDPQTLIVQQCGVTGEYAKGEFVITGRSGLPLNPLESVEGSEGIGDLRTPVLTEATPQQKPKFVLLPLPQPIIEAQGWVKGKDGIIILTAKGEATTTFHPLSCQGKTS